MNEICIANCEYLKPHHIEPIKRFWNTFNLDLYLEYLLKKTSLKMRINPFYKYLTKEQREHVSIVNYLKYKYPNLIWWHTMNEGKRTPYERFLFGVMGAKKSVPDFVILEPKNGYNGMLLELKAEGEKITKKDGKPLKDKTEQIQFLEACKAKGYYTVMVAGFDNAIKEINNYLK